MMGVVGRFWRSLRSLYKEGLEGHNQHGDCAVLTGARHLLSLMPVTEWAFRRYLRNE